MVLGVCERAHSEGRGSRSCRGREEGKALQSARCGRRMSRWRVRVECGAGNRHLGEKLENAREQRLSPQLLVDSRRSLWGAIQHRRWD
jgi:3'-phosphoadenosine 5'-phosphosulfate sulfotransferase